MGRAEKPLDPRRGPAAELAAELRALRDAAGRPSYRELAARAGFSPAALSQAASGRNFPSWPVVQAFVTACGADEGPWQQRWVEVERAHRLYVESSAGDPDAELDDGTVDEVLPGQPSGPSGQTGIIAVGRFELYRDGRGKFRFRLKARSGQVIAVSEETYESEAQARQGINTLAHTFADSVEWIDQGDLGQKVGLGLSVDAQSLPTAHLGPEAIAAFIAQQLSPTALDRAAAHVAACPECTAKIAAERHPPLQDSLGRSSAGPISVFLLDDHEIVRRGVRQLLEVEDDIEVIGEAATAAEAMAMIPELKPQVAILDVRLPDGDGVTVCREVRARTNPPPACLMLTSYSDDEALFGAIMAGASGYMIKQVSGNDVVAAVRTLGAGGSLLDTGVTATVLNRLRHGPAGDPRYRTLSPQERKILDLIAEGLTNRQIAAQLYMAEKTVKNYVSTLLHKLRFDRRTEAAVYATRLRQRDIPIIALDEAVRQTVAQAADMLGFEPWLGMSASLNTVVPEEIRPELLAMLQHALKNVFQHARASSVTVELRTNNGKLTLTVVDDGVGIPEGAAMSAGWTLASTRRRAERLGGTLTVEPGDGRGTRLTWTVALPRGRTTLSGRAGLRMAGQ
jgi:two-component system, NarL family, response regulator DevR